MPSNLNPLISSQPGQKTRLWTALEGMLRKFALDFDHVLPASVVSFNRAKNTATVQPLIQIVKLDGTTMSRNPLASVPVASFGGGGFHISFPLAAGNLGWIFATDRDYSNFMQSLKEAAPNTTRAHKFEDSLFIPDVMRQYVINAEDNESMVIQTVDAATRISVNPGQVKVTGPTTVIIDSPTTQILHDLSVGGNLTVAENATVNGTLTNNGIDVTTHGHISESPGTRTGNMEA